MMEWAFAQYDMTFFFSLHRFQLIDDKKENTNIDWIVCNVDYVMQCQWALENSFWDQFWPIYFMWFFQVLLRNVGAIESIGFSAELAAQPKLMSGRTTINKSLHWVKSVPFNQWIQIVFQSKKNGMVDWSRIDSTSSEMSVAGFFWRFLTFYWFSTQICAE